MKLDEQKRDFRGETDRSRQVLDVERKGLQGIREVSRP